MRFGPKRIQQLQNSFFIISFAYDTDVLGTNAVGIFSQKENQERKWTNRDDYFFGIH